MFALFCLFAAPAAQAMLLELNFHWEVGTEAHPDLLSYNLQEGSIIQVIAIKKETTLPENFGDAAGQFDPYGIWAGDPMRAEPYKPDIDPDTHEPIPVQPDDPDVPGSSDVFLADTTPDGTDILYTGSLQSDSGWYGLYTQIYIDDYIYDRVYIRVFGATDFEQGVVAASYWGVSEIHNLNPTFQFDTFEKANQDAPTATYFEVVPEPATLGLLGLGGCALAAWRRRRPQEDKR